MPKTRVVRREPEDSEPERRARRDRDPGSPGNGAGGHIVPNPRSERYRQNEQDDEHGTREKSIRPSTSQRNRFSPGDFDKPIPLASKVVVTNADTGVHDALSTTAIQPREEQQEPEEVSPIETGNPKADEEEETSGGDCPVRTPLECSYVIRAESSRPVVRHRAILARLGA